MCAIIKDESPYVLEWASFHLAQGVSRITIWDDGSSDRESTLARLAPLRSVGAVAVLNVADIVRHVEEWADAVHAVRQAWRADVGNSSDRALCGPTDEEVSNLRTWASACIAGRNVSTHVDCQITTTRLCTAWAKTLGDSYTVLIDVDEFLWAPPEGCWAGGPECLVDAHTAPLLGGNDFPAGYGDSEDFDSSGQQPDSGQDAQSSFDADGYPIMVADDDVAGERNGSSSGSGGGDDSDSDGGGGWNWGGWDLNPFDHDGGPDDADAPPTLLDGLDFYLGGPIGRLHAQVSVYGGMFGPASYRHANWSAVPDPHTGLLPLVTESHVWSAPYSGHGYIRDPPGGCGGEYASNVCGSAYPEKSVVSIRAHPATPISGIVIHEHHIGPTRTVRHREGEALRYNHYSYLSIEETREKKVVRNKNPPSHSASQVVANTNGARDWFNGQYSPAAAAYAPLLRHCMATPVDDEGRLRPECGVSLPDWRGV